VHPEAVLARLGKVHRTRGRAEHADGRGEAGRGSRGRLVSHLSVLPRSARCIQGRWLTRATLARPRSPACEHVRAPSKRARLPSKRARRTLS
jgi:hypothetical protein